MNEGTRRSHAAIAADRDVPKQERWTRASARSRPASRQRAARACRVTFATRDAPNSPPTTTVRKPRAVEQICGEPIVPRRHEDVQPPPLERSTNGAMY